MDLDSVSRSRLNLVYPDLATRYLRMFHDVAKVTGRSVRVTEGLRTFQRQAALYAQGRTEPGPIVTNSMAGESLHHYGCAIDSCWMGKDPYLERLGEDERRIIWSEYGRVARAHGFEWGGDWKRPVDKPHIQLRYGYTSKEIREFYRVGGMTAVWASFDEQRGVQKGQEWNSVRRSRLARLFDKVRASATV